MSSITAFNMDLENTSRIGSKRAEIREGYAFSTNICCVHTPVRDGRWIEAASTIPLSRSSGTRSRDKSTIDSIRFSSVA